MKQLIETLETLRLRNIGFRSVAYEDTLRLYLAVRTRRRRTTRLLRRWAADALDWRDSRHAAGFLLVSCYLSKLEPYNDLLRSKRGHGWRLSKTFLFKRR